MIKASFKLGSSVSLQIESVGVKEMFQDFELLSQLPQSCSCGSTDIVPGFQLAQKQYEYYWLKCRTCGNEFHLGQRKSDKGLFPKTSDGWKPAFKGNRDEGGGGGNDDDGWN